MAKSYSSIKAFKVGKTFEKESEKKSYKDIKSSEYDFGVDDEYIKSFYDDFAKYSKDAEKDYDGITYGSDVSGLYDKYSSQTSDIRDKASTIRAFLNSQKSNLKEESYNSLIESLDSIGTVADDTIKAFEKRKDFYSTFGTEYDYNAYLLNNTSGVDSDSLNARKGAYESISSRLAELAKEIADTGYDQKTTHTMSASGLLVPTNYSDKETTDKYNSLVDEKNRLEAELRKYERGNKKTDELYFQYSGNEDWAEDSAKRDLNTPNERDLGRYGTVNIDTGDVWDIDEASVTMEDPLGTYLAFYKGEDGYDYGAVPEMGIPNPTSAEEDTHALTHVRAYNEAIQMGQSGHWELFDPEEINLYYYLMNNGQKDIAMSYLKGMQTELDRRATEGRQKELEEANALELLFHNVVSIPANIVGGATAFVDDVFNTMVGKDINPYSGGHSIQNYAQGVRTATANDINRLTGASEDDWITWGDAYQGLMSGADSVVGSLALGGGYTYLMGMGSAASEAKELYESGASKEQIIGGGLLAGAAEAFFEKFSVGYFLDDILGAPSKNLTQIAVKTLGMAGVEAAEELGTTLANYISDAVVRGSTSDWAGLIEQYKKAGYSDSQAIWKAVKKVGGEALHDAAVGAISGGGMGMVGNTISAVQYDKAAKTYGKEIIDAGGVDTLKNLALDMAGAQSGLSKSSLTHRAKVASKADTTTQKGAKAVGVLADTVDTVKAKQNKADIVSALQEKGVDSAKAKEYANILVAMNEDYFNGNGSSFTLGTDEQWERITGDKNAYSVLSSVVTDKKSPVNIRNLAVGNAKRGIRVDKEGNLNEADKAAYQERRTTQLIQAIAESKGIQEDVENNLDVSDDGKTYVSTDSGTIEVTSKKFVDSEDGTLKVRVNGEQDVDTSSVSYGNVGEALVVSAIVDLGVGAEDANALYNMLEGVDAKTGQAYANGISLAFKYGRYFYSPAKLNGIVGVSKKVAQEAFRIGRKSRSEGAKAAKAQLDATAEANAKEGKKVAAKGSVVYEGVIADENGNLAAGEDSLTGVQKASVNGLKLIAELSPINFHLFQSKKDGDTFTYVKKNGEATHANGWYRVGTNDIYIDLNAGVTGDGTVMYTAAHEISHFIKEYSPEKWDKIAEYIMSEYCAHYGGKVDALLLKHITAIKARPDANTKTQQEIEDEAFEDLVCDSLSKMLIDGTVVEAMANIKQKDKGVWNAIKNAVLKLLEKWSAVIDQYSGRNPDAEEAGYFRETSKAFKKLQGMLTEAFVDAGDTYSKVGNLKSKQSDVMSDRVTAEESKAVKAFGKDIGTVDKNENGDMLVAANKDGSTVMYSERTWRMGGKEKFIATMTALGHGDQAQEYAKYLDDALGYLHELAVGYEILGQHLDADIVTDIKNGKQVLSAIVNNGDYPVNIDLALICKKRVAYMRLMAKMIEDGVFGDVKYDGDAIAEVNKILRKNGFETACLGCFVESRRLQFQTWAETIVQEWNEAVEARNKYAHYFRFADGKASLTDEEIEALDKELATGGKKNDKGNLNLGQGSVAAKMGRLLDKVPSLARKLTVDDLLTPQGLTALRSTDSNLFSLVKQRYGAASPKIVQDYNPYASEIADLTFNFVKKVTGNNIKGAKDYILGAKKELGDAPKKLKSESKEEFKERKAEYDAKVESLAMQKYLYSIGGARIQSFSDFMIENVFDYLQIFADLAAKELPMHGYTKEIVALRLFGMSGAKWNGSLIAHVDKSMGKEYAGLLPASEAKNGNGILVKVDGKDYCIGFDDYARNKATNGDSFIQSIGVKDIIALMYDPRYSPYVGNITIGVSDKQIMAMLDSPLFRMVIPYHASGMLPQFAQLVGVDMYNDYTNYQNTTVKTIRLLNDTDYTVKVGDNGKPKVVKKADGKDVGIDTHYAFNEMLQKYGDARKTCNDYLAWCRNEHPIYDKGKVIGYATFNAKFSDSPTGVDFTRHRNYYKLIEDFNTYDNITENPTQQGAVTMNFPSAENRLTAEQKKAYEKALRDTGIFTEADIKKYLEKADMTFEEIVRAEVGNRKAYNDAQEPKFDSTVKEVEDYLLNAKDDKGNYKFRRDAIADTASDYIEAKNHGISLKPATGSYLDEVKLEDRMLPQSYIDNMLDEFGITNPGDYQQVQKRVMSTLVGDGFFTDEEMRNRTDVNEESGMVIETNKSGIDETFDLQNYARVGRWKKFAKLATIRRLPEIIRNGHVVTKNAPNMYGGTARNKKFAYIEHTLVEGGKEITISLDIKKSPQKNKFWVHKAIDIKSVSDSPASTETGTEAGQSTADTDGMVSHTDPNVKEKLSDRDSTGRTLTKAQQEFFKDSKIRDKDGNLRVVYHGTNAEFTVFDIGRSGQNYEGHSQFGRGVYFAGSSNGASDWSDGGKVKPYYIDIKKPFYAGKETPKELLELVGAQSNTWAAKRGELFIGYLNGKGIDSTDFLKEHGYDGIVDEPEPNPYIRRHPIHFYQYVVFSPEQIKSTDNLNPTKDPDILYSDRVTNKNTLDFLNDQLERGEVVEVYRAMQIIDGKLYPPMNAYMKDDDGKNVLVTPSEIGTWEMSVERPDMRKKDGKFPLKKGKVDGIKGETDIQEEGTGVNAAYNPYLHVSLTPLNDQFSSAYRRSNLVVVKGYVPKSELTSGYHAEGAKDPVGLTEWHSGTVSSKLPDVRKVILSRYFMPMEVVSDRFVAEWVKDAIGDNDIEIPFNVVTPKVRRELESLGVRIGEAAQLRNPPKKDEVVYQDRGNSSTRTLLANALESTIDSSTPEGQIELAKLKEYKEMVGTLDELTDKLSELRGRLFSKGVTGDERRRIQDEATKTANRISIYDKKLLTLESTKPIKRLLDREKAQAVKKQKAIDAENLAAYKKASEDRMKEQAERFKESREKVKETRAKSEAKAKLQKLVLDTARWISYPKKDEVKCPDILRAPYADFLRGIDMSSKRVLNGGEQTNNDLRMAMAMDSLATAIQRIKDAQNPATESGEVLDSGYLDLPAFFVEKLREMAEKTKELIVEGDYVVNRMSSAEIKQLTMLIRTLNHSIKEMSTLYSNMRFANVEALGDDTISFLEDIYVDGGINAVKDFFAWDNALPYYAFKRFGKGGESIFEELMDAQDKMAFLAKEIMTFREKAWTDKEAKAWSEDTHTLHLPSGKDITLTTADAMSIYCLARRDNGQGLNHLLGGGVRVLGEKKGAKQEKDSKVELTFEDVVAIGNSLTDRQIEVAEAVQEFMSTVCSEWGNEISMKRFLTKDFTEKRYFPIQSNDEVLAVKDPQAQQSDLYRLLNISATKPLTPNANNSVIVRNIFDVFTEHTSDMARLNAYGMALLDYMKWVNYNEKTKNENGQISVRGVRGAMNEAYGAKAQSYVIGLIKDINGRANDNGDHPWLMKMTRMAKTASVGSSLRVAALQFTSYPRAAMVLSTANLAKGWLKRPQISKAKKYCGVALWKSFGFYDTNIARSIEDQIKGTTNWRQKLIELSLKGAEWGDSITWGYLWNACEYDVATSNNQLKVGSEEFNQAVAKRLREVVYATQVVDSVLTRSSMMRSKSGLTQTATAFMSEPTLAHNILMDSFFQFSLEKRRTGSAKAAWKKCGGHIRKAVSVFAVGQIVTALVESLIDAYRDDEDEEFFEKFGKAMLQNAVSDIIVFNKVPIIADMIEGLLSLFGIGYFSSDRLDMTWLTDTRKALESWVKVFGEAFGVKDTSVTTYKALYDTVKALSSTTGIAFSGLLREIITLWNNTAGAADPDLKIKKYDD